MTPKKKFNLPNKGKSINYIRNTKSNTGESNTSVTIPKGGEYDSLSKDQITDAYAELHKRYVNNEELTREERKNYEYWYPNIMWAKYRVSAGNIQSVLGGGDSLDPYVTERFGK